MERSRKLTLTDRTKANDALFLHFEGNKSKLAKHLNKDSRTTITAFFNQKPLSEPEFRKICLALRLNWQEVSAVDAIAPEQDWIEEVRSRCCEKILYQHSTIQLLNQAEIRVDQLYVDVWVLKRSPRTFQPPRSMSESFDLRNDRLGMGDRIKQDEGIKVANDEPRLLILGKPGTGKTTFLKHLAVDCSNGKFQPNLIPVLIELRRIESTQWKLLNAISEELSLDNQQTQTLLKQGKLLILMDGLDEVSTNTFRRDVQNQVRDLAQEPKYSHNRLILTCRTQIVEVVPQGLTSVEVAEFKPGQVKKFVENWFRAAGQTEADITRQWQAFSDATETSPALKELTVTPVLLSLMCWVFQDLGDLPAQAFLLYQKGIRLLLEKWNDRKDIPEWEIGTQVYRKLEPDQKEALLIEIAARKFENPDNFVLFEQRDLAKQIANFLNLGNVGDGEIVLRAIEAQHGLLVERADELWSFSHLTFQEYFTAQWLSQLQDYVGLAEKIANRRWQEVVRLATKTQRPADRFLQLLKQAIDYSVSNDPQFQNFLMWVQTKTESIQPQYESTRIRAFYFALVVDVVRDRNLDFDIVDLPLDLDFDLYLDRTLPLDLTHIIPHTHDYARPLALALDHALRYAYDLDPKLASKLEILRLELPQCSKKNWEKFQEWWQQNNNNWTVQLRQALIEHRNIGHDWQFNELQQQALQSYSDANQFLLRLLEEPGAVSDHTRQEIEDNLLLPIAELKRRLPDQYS